MSGEGPCPAVCHRRRSGGRPAPVHRRRPDSRPADTGLGTRLEMGQAPARPSWHCSASARWPPSAWCSSSSGTTSHLRGKLDVALTEERRARQREHDAREEQRLALVQQEGQKLFDSARVAVAASDWPSARARPGEGTDDHRQRDAGSNRLKEPAQALLETGRAGTAASKPTGGRLGPASSSSPACATRPSSWAPCTRAWIWPPTSRPRAPPSRRRWPSMASCPVRQARPEVRCLPERCAEGRDPGGLLSASA